jgi:uncharacterized phage protein (TIGR01671 family)
MREILFKAKRIDNGEWVEGYLFDNGFDGEEKKYFVGGLVIEKYNGTACDEWDITGIDFCEIDPETLCQFTGETDKNGKRIWESDVVWLVYDGKEHIYQIVWDNSELDFKATNGEENYGSNFEYLLCCDEIEVIGNIFDNPELLQEESNE